MCLSYPCLVLKCHFWWPDVSTAVLLLFLVLGLETQIGSLTVRPTSHVNPPDQRADTHDLPVVWLAQLSHSFSYVNTIPFCLFPFSLCLNCWRGKGAHQAIFASRSWKMYKWVTLNMHVLVCSCMKPEGTAPHQQRANTVPKQPSMCKAAVRQGKV